MTAERAHLHRAADPDTDESSAGRLAGWRHRYQQHRERLRQRRLANAVYRAGVGCVGSVIVVVGIIAIPYPGPGWAIFFLGLAVLATEFAWAKWVLKFAKTRYDAVMEWVRRQPLAVQALGVLFTTAVVLGTLWMVGVIGWGAGVIGVDWPWLRSPVGFGW